MGFEGSKEAIFDEKMAVGKSENLVTLHLYNLTQPSDKEILGGSADLGYYVMACITARTCTKIHL